MNSGRGGGYPSWPPHRQAQRYGWRFQQAFDVDLRDFVRASGRYRGRTGPVQVPPDLDKVVIGVFRPRQWARRETAYANSQAFGPRSLIPGGYTPIGVGAAYNFPAGLDGTGKCIAIIKLGGGYKTEDPTTYFMSLGLQAASVKAVSVDHATNKPIGAGGSDAEVMLNIEVAGAAAPRAELVVYFAPNTDQGFLDAVNAARHDATNSLRSSRLAGVRRSPVGRRSL